jgi:hypothetical protein
MTRKFLLEIALVEQSSSEAEKIVGMGLEKLKSGNDQSAATLLKIGADEFQLCSNVVAGHKPEKPSDFSGWRPFGKNR